jgi:hypothetical protein
MKPLYVDTYILLIISQQEAYHRLGIIQID